MKTRTQKSIEAHPAGGLPGLCFITAALFLTAATAKPANLLTNGSFEDPVVPLGLNYTFPPGWLPGAPVSEYYLVRGTSGEFPPPFPFPDGTQVLGVRTDGTVIRQDFSLAGPSALLLTFWDAHEIGSGSLVTSWATITDLSSSGVVGTSPHFEANLNDTWKLNSWSVGSLNAGNYELSLRLGGEAVYDGVQIVPEPRFLALFTLGGLLLLNGLRTRSLSRAHKISLLHEAAEAAAIRASASGASPK